MTTTPLPYPTFDDFPRIKFASFERAVYDDAGSSCRDLFTHGLLFLVVSDRTWATLPNNTTVTDNITTTLPRPTFQPPIQPPDNATTGVWKTFETRRKLFDTYSAAALLLLRRIKLTLPAADNNLLSHPVLGLVNFSAFALMEHLRMTYGNFQATDFQQLYLHLEQKISTTTDFPTLAANFRLIFEQFSAHNQPLSELQKCTYLANAISGFPHLVKAFDTYSNLHPLPEDRQFLELATHITIHAPNFAPTTADHGYVASAAGDKLSSTFEDFLRSPQLATLIATAAAAVKTPPNRSKQPRVKNSAPTTHRTYCYLHGYNWHSSADCKNMARDPTRFPNGARTAQNHLAGESINQLDSN